MRRAQHHFSEPGRFIRAAVKQVRHIAHHKLARLVRQGRAPVAHLACWPSMPHPYSVVYRVSHQLGIRLVPANDTTPRGTPTFLWLDDTHVRQGARPGWINGQCLDISKNHVERVHQQVFGYGLEVDATTHEGPVVVKSDANGAHDGQVQLAPLPEMNPLFVYQRVVDNRPPEGGTDRVCDLRTCIFQGRPTFAYLKLREKSSRFSNTNDEVRLAQAADLFNALEMAQITAFCHAMGLDYGEIDVVRDHTSGRIYILDVNKTPLGPPNGLAAKFQQVALRLYRQHFTDMVVAFAQRRDAGI